MHLREVRALRIAPAYVTAVVALRVTMCVAAGAAFRTTVVNAASTNVVNLAEGRFATLLTSAFVLEGRACLLALLALGAVLALAELAWGGLVLAAVAVLGALLTTRTLPHTRRWRAGATVVALAAVLVDRTFADVGYLLALLLGFGVGCVAPVRKGVRHGPDREVIPGR